jgi:hypothetical protein
MALDEVVGFGGWELQAGCDRRRVTRLAMDKGDEHIVPLDAEL